MSDTSITVPWRTIAIGSLLLNLGTIGAVATIATLDRSNALATVALALAIISFICQLIVFTVQGWQSGEQLKQAESLNAETIGLISEMRTRIEGTHEMVSSQYKELLHLTTLKSVADAASTKAETNGSSGEVIAAAVAEAASSALQNSTVPTPSQIRGLAVRGDTDQRYTDWPSSLEEAKVALEALEKLTPHNIGSFILDVGLQIVGDRLGERLPIKVYKSDGPLIDAGLLAQPDEENSRLTNHGNQAARLIVSPWPPPRHLESISERLSGLRSLIPENDRKTISNTLGIKV
jgi:hypothetical protein